MRILEIGWGIIYLFSGIFVIIVSIWDFPIILEHSHIILFNYFAILVFILELVFGFVFIGLSIKSVKHVREDKDEAETTSIVAKIIVWVSNIYQAIMIGVTINFILFW